MHHLPFKAECFDLIWSEGAIYIMGFKNGLQKWKSFLRPKGFIAVSELTWLRTDIPDDVSSYWLAEYPVKSISENIEIIHQCGYDVIGHFALPVRDWWDNYYSIIQQRLPLLRQKYADDPDALQVIDMEQAEMEMHKKYSDFYGYVFYVMQNRPG
jgi:SAM-dependent methyltransferase